MCNSLIYNKLGNNKYFWVPKRVAKGVLSRTTKYCDSTNRTVTITLTRAVATRHALSLPSPFPNVPAQLQNIVVMLRAISFTTKNRLAVGANENKDSALLLAVSSAMLAVGGYGV